MAKEHEGAVYIKICDVLCLCIIESYHPYKLCNSSYLLEVSYPLLPVATLELDLFGALAHKLCHNPHIMRGDIHTY